MRILALALALCGALLTAGLAQAAPADRTALLGRLKAAIPPDDGPEPGAADAEKIRRTLTPLNPGREKEVEALAAARFACEQALISKARILDLIVESADKRMSDAEIERLISFYEGPEFQALAALQGRPEDDPELQAAGTKLLADPIFVKFMSVIRASITDYMEKPGVMEAIMACETGYADALAESGLAHP